MPVGATGGESALRYGKAMQGLIIQVELQLARAA
jgi:hypothetical protein